MYKGGGYIQRRRGRFWEGRIDVQKWGGGIFWEGGVDHGSVARSCEKRSRVDSRSVALYKRWVYSGREGYILGGLHIDLRCLKGGVYILGGRGTVRDGYI